MKPDCTLIIPAPHSLASPVPHVTFHLHREHVTAKSLLLRGLFKGVSALDMIKGNAPLRIPPSRLPRLLSSSPSHPVLFLPVPDPFSIQLLLHWTHLGTTDHIQTALDRGEVQWEGLVRNVEYLGLPTDIKVFLGNWYRIWHLPAHCPPCPDDDEDDSDEDDGYCSSTFEPGDDQDMQCDQECDRGRSREVKPLLQWLSL